MKIILIILTGFIFLIFSIYRIMYPAPIKASASANELLLDVLTTLGSAFIGIGCLWLAYRTKRKERREQKLIRKWEKDFGK